MCANVLFHDVHHVVRALYTTDMLLRLWFFAHFPLNSEWVSEWLLFNVNSAICQLYHGEIKLIFNETMMRSAL
jgi:hypothetical protein